MRTLIILLGLFVAVYLGTLGFLRAVADQLGRETQQVYSAVSVTYLAHTPARQLTGRTFQVAGTVCGGGAVGDIVVVELCDGQDSIHVLSVVDDGPLPVAGSRVSIRLVPQRSFRFDEVVTGPLLFVKTVSGWQPA